MYRFTDTLKLEPRMKKVICDHFTPISLFRYFAEDCQYSFLFESAEINRGNGRYSFIGFDQLLLFEFPVNADRNPLDVLKNAYDHIQCDLLADIPFFQGGFIGYFSYEVVRRFESLHIPLDNAQIPEGIFYLPKNLLIFDHFEHTLTFIAYSEIDLAELLKKYEQCNLKNLVTHFNLQLKEGENELENMVYIDQVSQAKEKIKAGEIFQVVISQKFERKTEHEPLEIYRRLRYVSPSPYMFLLKFPHFSIIGSSPETLVKLEAASNEITVKPIAGTRKRSSNEMEDKRLEYELLHDPKENAEHMMLIDLGRNDIGKVCQPGSVQLKNVKFIQKLSHVMHMVSEIRGIRKADASLFDVFKAVFPAGTLSGAPKVRAMEIIAELENCSREIYGGAVGYFGFDGSMDFAIAIRTLLYKNGKVTFRAGAGIVYDSIPEAENIECCNKAKGPLITLAL